MRLFSRAYVILSSDLPRDMNNGSCILLLVYTFLPGCLSSTLAETPFNDDIADMEHFKKDRSLLFTYDSVYVGLEAYEYWIMYAFVHDIVTRVHLPDCLLSTFAETRFNDDITDMEHFKKDRSLLFIYDTVYVGLEAYEYWIMYAFVHDIVTRVHLPDCLLSIFAETRFNDDITDMEHFKKDRSLLFIYDTVYVGLEAYEYWIMYAFVHDIVTRVHLPDCLLSTFAETRFNDDITDMEHFKKYRSLLFIYDTVYVGLEAYEYWIMYTFVHDIVTRVPLPDCLLSTFAETSFNDDITDTMEYFKKDRSLLFIYDTVYVGLEAYEYCIVFAFVGTLLLVYSCPAVCCQQWLKRL